MNFTGDTESRTMVQQDPEDEPITTDGESAEVESPPEDTAGEFGFGGEAEILSGKEGLEEDGRAWYVVHCDRRWSQVKPNPASHGAGESWR